MNFYQFVLLSLVSISTSASEYPEKSTEFALSGILETVSGVAIRYSTHIEDYKKLMDLFELIDHIQSPTDEYLPQRTSLDDTLSDLQRFVDARFKVEGLRFKVYPGMGIGIEATKDIPAGTLLTNISEQHVLSSTQMKDELGCLGKIGYNDAKYQAAWDMTNLTLILLSHALGETEFRPYINSLPTKYAHPAYFTYEEMKSLQGSTMYVIAINTVQEMAAMYSQIYRTIKGRPSCSKMMGVPLHKFTLRAFQWAYTTVLTREYEGGFQESPLWKREKNLVMIPFWDIFNHNLDGHLLTRNQRSKQPSGANQFIGHYVTSTEKSIKKGEQVVHAYLHDMKPEAAFGTWGFVDYDEVTVPFSLVNLTIGQKVMAYRMPWWLDEHFTLYDPSQGPVIRSKVILDVVDLVGGKKDTELTPDNIRRAWEMILAQINSQLGNYLFSSEKYREMLRIGELSDNQKLIYSNFADEIDFLEKTKRYINRSILGSQS